MQYSVICSAEPVRLGKHRAAYKSLLCKQSRVNCYTCSFFLLKYLWNKLPSTSYAIKPSYALLYLSYTCTYIHIYMTDGSKSAIIIVIKLVYYYCSVVELCSYACMSEYSAENADLNSASSLSSRSEGIHYHKNTLLCNSCVLILSMTWSSCWSLPSITVFVCS